MSKFIMPRLRRQSSVVPPEVKSELYGIVCKAEEDMARQEFKKDVSITEILRRHIRPEDMRTGRSGFVDTSMDLQSALMSLGVVEDRFDEYAKVLPAEYDSVEAMVGGLLRGELEFKDDGMLSVKAPSPPPPGDEPPRA